MLTNEIMYNAILKKDITFEGTFITAVKTTGIFCRPTCTARKPKAENVEFLKRPAKPYAKATDLVKCATPLKKLERPLILLNRSSTN
ncbi:Ada metal-binding domain-containing protein [Pedobacter panaciterrae]